MAKAKPLEWSEVWVRLGDLVPNAKNPKYSTEASAGRLNASLDKLGQFETIAINFDGKSAVDGHQRLNAWIGERGADFKVRALKPNRKLTPSEVRQVILYGKGTQGVWDMDALHLHFNDTELVNFGGFDEGELAWLESSDFGAGSEDEQGQLDELQPVYVKCPHCGEQFDTRAS